MNDPHPSLRDSGPDSPAELREEDLSVSVYRGATTAVRITHAPTGLSVTADGKGSQLELKEIALRELRGMVARKLLGEGETDA